METIAYPDRTEWRRLLQRPYADNARATDSARAVLADIRTNGDASLRRMAKEYDGAELESLELSEAEISAAAAQVPETLQTAIRAAYVNIRAFHDRQLHEEPVVETMPGIRCWRRSVGIDRVGLYIPGGSAPLFSTVLMLGVPAQLAECGETLLCTPASPDGSVHPAILFAASLCGIHRVFRIGGAGAVAAMAYGTESVPRVDKIFGPGNQYVTAAKTLVQLDGVAIDMPAGPSEVCVIADESASPVFVAADLLSQAEHGRDSQVILLTDSEEFALLTQTEIDRQLRNLSRRDVAAAALESSRIVVLRSMEEAMELSNAYAPEHLILQCRNAAALAGSVRNAGSVFIGPWSPESVGDYASGTNHTLPTNGAARAWSGVSVDSFLRKITFQELSRDGLERIGGTVAAMAAAEGLDAHAFAVTLRLDT